MSIALTEEQSAHQECSSETGNSTAGFTASVNYTIPLDLYQVEKPFFSNVPAPDGRQSNQVACAYPGTKVQDIRGKESQFNLDSHGFEIVKFGPETTSGNFDSDDWIQSKYYDIVEAVIKARLGEVRVKVFDHTVRKRKTHLQLDEAGGTSRATRQPSYSAHCDQTFLSGENRVKLHMGSQASDLLGKRCQIINVWRPLFGPLYDCPLIYCDWKTVVPDRDFLAADLIFPHYIGEQYLVTHHPDHQWYFLGGQRTNEFTFLKCWDSDQTVARCVPHTSFINPRTPDGVRLRESVEFRCLVFYSSS
ncbi:hypothetical protein F5Y10DRAFT_180440 [Nemania abortiva]|nr:hypothetical protein F5Y10DRAFT_180440 [Nemania abortiva]